MLNAEVFLKINPMRVSIPTSIMRKPEQKAKNLALTLKTIYHNPSIARKDVVKLVGLAPSTAYRLIVNLKESRDIYVELGSGKSKYGNEFFTATDKGKLKHESSLKGTINEKG